MRRTVFVVCPSCRLVVRQDSEDGEITHTYRVDTEPCERCRKKPAGRIQAPPALTRDLGADVYFESRPIATRPPPVACPTCGAALQVPLQVRVMVVEGRTIRPDMTEQTCTGCGATVQIPLP